MLAVLDKFWLEDVREDVYGVFVTTQDETSAMTKAYAGFVRRINDLVKEQLRTRELIKTHLEKKTDKHSELNLEKAD